MRTRLSIFLFCFLALAGCKKAATTNSSTSRETSAPAVEFDACKLITKLEVEAVQGSRITDTKSSERTDGSFRVSQCYYSAAESNKSVSLAITRRDPSSGTKRSPREFWEQTFGRFEGEVKEQEGDAEKRKSLEEEEEKATPPKKIEGVGDEAFWAPSRIGGALYVLKEDAFIRVSVGGPDKEEAKIGKSKALAEKALSRL